MSSASNLLSVEDGVEGVVRQLYGLGMVQREIGRHALAETGSQGFVALAAIHLNDGARVSDVAHRLGVDLSVASRQVAALEAAGYVTREPDPADRRAHRLTTTEAGKTALHQSHLRMVAAFERVLAGWPEEDVGTLARLLARLRTDHAEACASPDQAKAQEAAA